MTLTNRLPIGGTGGGNGGDGNGDVKSGIDAKYAALGGATGFLGSPVSAGEIKAPDGIGRFRNYEHGTIWWHPDIGAFEVHGLILQRYRALSAQSGPLGYPTSDETPTADGTARFNTFQRGVLFWTPALGTRILLEPISRKWQALGAAAGFLGQPVTDDTATPNGKGRYAHFQGGSIYSTPLYGAFEVHGLIRARWSELSWEQGFLGFPVSDETDLPDGSGRYNLFEHGIITWQRGAARAVEGAHHYERIYAALRAKILGRFFAIGHRGRRNHLSLQNRLAGPIPAGAQAEPARWRIVECDGENPMLWGSLLYTMLLVEHNAGNAESTRALKAGLATLESLYLWRLPGTTSSRLPLRWDAGLPVERAGEWDQFLAGRDGQYMSEITPIDLNHFPRRGADTLKKLLGPDGANQYGADQDYYWRHYRQCELSQDELTGLVAIYSLASKLSRDADISASVKRQAGMLGNYLADNGYLLVKPHRGLSYRGATGFLPALEFPFSRVLGGISGFQLDSRADFQAAMENAGYWGCLSGPVNTGRALGMVIGIALPILSPVMALLGLGVAEFEALVSSQVISPGTLGAAAAVAQNTECFDVEETGEVAAALLLKETSNKRALYRTVALAQAISAGYRSWSVNFHVWIGLTGVDDADSQVADTYRGWFADRLAHANLEVKGRGAKSIFAAGVATLVNNDGGSEQLLLDRIDQAIVELFRGNYFDPQLPSYVDGGVTCECVMFPSPSDQQPYDPLDLCGGLALAFWHAQRRHDAGNAVTTARFPQPLSADRFASWPVAAVPADCLLSLAQVDVPVSVVQGNDTPVLVNGGYPLYMDPPVPRHPVPMLPVATPTTLAVDTTVAIHAQDKGDVDTGIVVYPNQDIHITATGDIWAGNWSDGRNGPDGLSRTINDTNWPLHSGIDDANATAYCLLGRLNGYFFIGSELRRTPFRYPKPRRLYLRINDDGPGDGNGKFDVHIQVWGHT